MAIEELYAIAAEMRYQGRHGIREETAKQLRRGHPVIREAVRTNVIAVLPHRGGLGVWVAQGRFTMPVYVGARIIGRARFSKAGHDLQGIDDGQVIHPGNGFSSGAHEFIGQEGRLVEERRNRKWYHQQVPPNSISGPIREEGGYQLELAGFIAIEEAAYQIVGA